MEITEEQQIILDSLVCERLRTHPSTNSQLVQNFTNDRGEALIEYLQQLALQEDIEGKTAFYIIKTKNNEPLLYFSLKCGSLYDEFLDAKKIEDYKKNDFKNMLLIQAIKNAGVNVSDVQHALERLQSLCLQKNQKPLEVLQSVVLQHKIVGKLNVEQDKEENDRIIRVYETFSGVEIAQLCKNVNAVSIWKQYNMPQPMGKTLFWAKIIPILLQLQDIAGCEYAYLFAADLTEDMDLINYYKYDLHFESATEVGTNKPYYDWLCPFMCQRINVLKQFRELFFKSFNPDEE